MARVAGLPRYVEIEVVAAPAGAQLPGQQPNYCQPDPLSKAKRLKNLTLGVLESQRDRVYRGNRQAAPRLWGLNSKLQRRVLSIKSIRTKSEFEVRVWS